MKSIANQPLRLILVSGFAASAVAIGAFSGAFSVVAQTPTPTPTTPPSTTETPVATLTQTVTTSIVLTLTPTSAPVVVTATTATTSVAPSAARPPNMAGVNLLTNPGHEHPGANFGGRGDINVTWNWNPFWEEPPAGVDSNNPGYRTPEFRATFARDNAELVRSGAGSDRWRNSASVNRRAGIMQYMADLPVGAPIRFTSWVQLRSNDDAAPNAASKKGDLKVRLCIDQDGGPRDLTDANLVCSDWKQPYDTWEQISIDGIAKNSVANAIIWSTADTPFLFNDVYVDESCFELLPGVGGKGICAGAGWIETGPNVLPLPANVGDIKISAADQAKLAQAQAQGPNTATLPAAAPAAPAAAGALTAPSVVTPSLVVNARVSLNIREQPSPTATIANNVKRGTVLTVTGKSEDTKWFQVDLEGQIGWVLGSLTLPNAAAQAVPVAR